MNSSANLKELASALSKAQATLQVAKKVSENPYFHSKYADLLSVWTACREALTTNGLSVVQVIDIANDGKAFLETILLHESGEWITGRLPLLAIKQDPQSQGSAISYARRYSLSAIIGLCTEEDDDAEGAMDRETLKSEAASEPKRENICPIHGVPFKKYTKGDDEWWSHKTKDGWCNKEKTLNKEENPLVEEAKRLGAVVLKEPVETGALSEPPEFKNVGEFLTKAIKTFPELKTKGDIEKILGSNIEKVTNFQGAWVFLTESLKNA